MGFPRNVGICEVGSHLPPDLLWREGVYVLGRLIGQSAGRAVLL